MALSKTITMTHQYIGAATSPTAVSYVVEASVSEGNLVATQHQTKPGVFTAGTASESYGGANINPDSNS